MKKTMLLTAAIATLCLLEGIALHAQEDQVAIDKYVKDLEKKISIEKQNREKAWAIIKKSDKLINQKKFKAAETIVRNEIDRNPKCIDMLNTELAIILMKTDRIEEGEQILKQIKHQGCGEIWQGIDEFYKKGCDSINKGKNKLGATLLEKYISLSPKQPKNEYQKMRMLKTAAYLRHAYLKLGMNKDAERVKKTLENLKSSSASKRAALKGELPDTNSDIPVVTDLAELDKYVGKVITIKGKVTNTKIATIIGVDVTSANPDLRGQEAEATGILRKRVVTKEGIQKMIEKHGMIANRGPGTFYRLKEIDSNYNSQVKKP